MGEVSPLPLKPEHSFQRDQLRRALPDTRSHSSETEHPYPTHREAWPCSVVGLSVSDRRVSGSIPSWGGWSVCLPLFPPPSLLLSLKSNGKIILG